MPRLLTTSASACRKLILKAELMGIDTAALEFQEAQVNIIFFIIFDKTLITFCVDGCISGCS